MRHQPVRPASAISLALAHSALRRRPRPRLWKLSAKTGHPFWSIPRMAGFLAASTDRVYVVDKHNNFTILSRDRGEPLASFPLGQFTKHLANDHSDRIYLATEAGLVMCLHEQGREFARFHMHPDRQPILPEFAPEGAGEDAEEMQGRPDRPADDADMPADGEKPETDNPDEETPGAEKPDEDKPEAEKPAEASPDDEKP